ncbi:hypothetical protein FDUTEX481_02636 [Tolypothrix sp. PCC 7601]|nr:hypothetical protein FDUTEX481_02636 [Tolypothrix sp. PCC 7601]
MTFCAAQIPYFYKKSGIYLLIFNLRKFYLRSAKAGDQALAYEGEKITLEKNYRYPI